MMVGRDGVFGITLLVSAVCGLAACGGPESSGEASNAPPDGAEAPAAPSNAPLGTQDSPSVACADLYSRSPLEDLTRCVEQGHAGAQSALGLKYAGGAGVPEDDVEAVRLYRLAAEQGHAGGQWLLGSMYGTGDGVPENEVLALMWFSLSADQGNGSALESKEFIEMGMTHEQIVEAERLSREWIEEHP